MQDNVPTTTKRRPRVLFFGMRGDFSTPSLQALLSSDIDVCAVVVPITPIPGLKQLPIQLREQPRGVRSALPLLSLHPSIIQIAWQHQIPVWEVRSLSDSTTYSTLAAYEPDIICVACFSQRIPRSIINLPRLGCLNVHPSLLPTNRGPVPLFWTFRNGEHTTGVTIHYLVETMDTGDILAQEHIQVPDGITYAQLEMQCAARGSTLLASVVRSLYMGETIRTVQDPTKSSYYSFPTDEDYIVHAEEWDARHIYNFINGIGHWDNPVEIHLGQQVFFTRECISYSREDRDNQSKEIYGANTSNVDIPCRNGWVTIRMLEN